MATVYNRRSFGLFDNGCFQDGTNRNFTGYNLYTTDSISGSACVGVVSYNSYGSRYEGSQFVKVNPETKFYQMAVSVRTISNNYLGNPGSGHLGFACYDAEQRFISPHQGYSTQNAVLTRAASPGDTVIYINRGDWSNSTTAHIRSINFYFPGSPFPNVGGYSRYNLYSPGYQLDGITQVSASEWRVDLENPLPNFGYPYVVGTELGRTQSGAIYNYVFGSPNYPHTWTTYVSPVMHGYVTNRSASSANFRDQTRFIRFLNLRNHNFRTERAGDSARYLIDNIILVECPSGNPYPNYMFSRSNVL